MVWIKAIAAATAAVISIGVFTTAAALAAPGDPGATLTRAKDDLAPLLKSRQLVAGDTWRQTVRVKGYRQIKLQLKQGSGAFRTVKTYKVPKNGKVKLSRTFPDPGGFSMRSIAVPDGKGRPVKGKPFIITVVAKRYQGTFGGERSSSTSWNGTITYFYQERDPVINRPWNDGTTHYTGIDGSVTWRFDASSLNLDTGVVNVSRRNCTASPNTGEIAVSALSANLTVEDDVDRTYNGRRYRVDVTAVSTPQFEYTCDYLRLDDFDNEIWVPETRQSSVNFGPNGGDLLTNSLSVAATGVDGQYTKSFSGPLVGDINRPPEAITNRWFWNLTPG